MSSIWGWCMKPRHIHRFTWPVYVHLYLTMWHNLNVILSVKPDKKLYCISWCVQHHVSYPVGSHRPTNSRMVSWANHIFFQRLLLSTQNNCWCLLVPETIMAGVEQVLYVSIQIYFIHSPSFGKASCLICIIQSVYGHTHQHTLYQCVFPSGAIP